MKWAIRFGLVCLTTVSIAFLLSQIPYLHEQARQHTIGGSSSVFRQDQALVLKEANVVDFMQRAPLQLKIQKLELSPSMLSVDLILKDKEQESSLVFVDLYEMPRYIFEHTGNMTQVFVRVLEANESTSKNPALLVAVGARRDQYTAADPAPYKKMNNSLMEQFVRSHYRLVETSRWNDLSLY